MKPLMFSMLLVGTLVLAAGTAQADTIVGWGANNYGVISNIPTGNDFIAIAAGQDDSIALKSDGSIVGWGLDRDGQISNIPTGNDFIAIASGTLHNLALKSDGSLVGWGNDQYGVTSNTPTGNDFKAIAAGHNQSMALKSDGSIVCWGACYASTPGGNDFIAIAAGADYSMALKSDGSIVGWGADWYGQVSDIPRGNDFIAIAAGFYHELALRLDGSIVGWGLDEDGRATPPPGNDFKAIAAGQSHNLALKSDGSIVGWGYDSNGQVSDTPTGNDFTAIAAGAVHSLALRADLHPVPKPVPIDIKPQSCPNPINVESRGVLPVAILGTADFDVTTIDPASIRLEGVAAIRWALEDVARPFRPPLTGEVDASHCTELGPDGFMDLTLKFNTQQVVAALGDVNDGDVLLLTLTGNLLNGTPIRGQDVVVILKKGK